MPGWKVRHMSWAESGRAWGERAADWAYLVEPYARRVNDTLFDQVHVGPGTRLLDIACGSGYAASTVLGGGAATEVNPAELETEPGQVAVSIGEPWDDCAAVNIDDPSPRADKRLNLGISSDGGDAPAADGDSLSPRLCRIVRKHGCIAKDDFSRAARRRGGEGQGQDDAAHESRHGNSPGGGCPPIECER